MLKFYSILFLFFTVCCFSQDEWRPLGPDDYNQISPTGGGMEDLTLDDNDVPYVAFLDYAADSALGRGVSVKRFINGHWEFVGEERFETADDLSGSFSIVVDHNNVPYVAYRSGNYLRIKKFNGTSWVNAGSQNYNCYLYQLAVDAQNNIYLAAAFGDSSQPGVRKFNGSSWSVVGEASLETTGCYEISMALAADGIPYVVYTGLRGSRNANVKRYNGTTWQLVGSANFTANTTRRISLKLTSNNVPYLVHTVNNTGMNIISKFNGSAWEEVWSAPTRDDEAVDIAIDGNDVLYRSRYIFANDTTEIHKLQGEEWVALEYSPEKVREMICDSENSLHILRYSYKCGLSKYVDGQWVSVGDPDIAGNNIVGDLRSHMAGDAENNIYCIYRDSYRNKAIVKKWTDGAWSVVGEELDAYSSSPVKIIIGPQSIPYIFYNGSGLSTQVKKLVDNTWVNAVPPQYIAPNASVAIGNAMIDADGTVYVVNSINNSNNISIFKHDGVRWVALPVLALNNYSGQVSFELHDGYIYVTYRDNTSNISPIMVSKINVNSGGWYGTDSETGIGIGGDPYLKKGPDGLYIAYSDATNNLNKITVKKLVGTSWELVGNAQFSNMGYEPVIDFDHSGTLYMLYYKYPASDTQHGSYSVMRYVNEEWVQLSANSFRAAEQGISFYHPSFAFFSNNTPIVAYEGSGIYAKYFGPEVLDLRPFNNISNELIVYPNPVKNSLYVSGLQGKLTAVIYDMSGKKVFAGKFTGNSLDVPLSKGLYILKVYDKEEYIATRKFIKE